MRFCAVLCGSLLVVAANRAGYPLCGTDAALRGVLWFSPLALESRRQPVPSRLLLGEWLAAPGVACSCRLRVASCWQRACACARAVSRSCAELQSAQQGGALAGAHAGAHNTPIPQALS
jgi:hypothetical protein